MAPNGLWILFGRSPVSFIGSAAECGGGSEEETRKSWESIEDPSGRDHPEGRQGENPEGDGTVKRPMRSCFA